jgi:hypothetical protein
MKSLNNCTIKVSFSKISGIIKIFIYRKIYPKLRLSVLLISADINQIRTVKYQNQLYYLCFFHTLFKFFIDIVSTELLLRFFFAINTQWEDVF